MTTRQPTPPRPGLYDPRHDHDSCGVGFVVDVQGRRSNAILRQGLTVLLNLEHRGACGCEANTGDGAGVLLQLPHAFLEHACGDAQIDLPAPGHSGVGMLFLPPAPADRQACERHLERIVVEEGQRVLGWRTVPTDNRLLGRSAVACEPAIRQLIIGRHPCLEDDAAFERKLYVIRKRAGNEIRHSGMSGSEHFYIASLSSRTVLYKGMLRASQLEPYYPDLADPRLATALMLVHSRFSTNTFPDWKRAHPYRYIAHNGEINTLRGNVNWMHARQALLDSDLFGPDLKKILPIINDNGSDSAMFDNCLEFLVLAGRPLPHAVMMMIPEPWENHESMADDRRAFYEYHSCLMEPWDGPAAVAFTNGAQIGAVLDRNGLRPARYVVTKDDRVIMGSEVGVLDVPPEQVLQKGRLQPGRMFLVDTAARAIVADEAIKRAVAAAHPYRLWLRENMLDLSDLAAAPRAHEPDHAAVVERQQAFGYTFEDLRLIIGPMARDGVQPLGSMGTDTPLAVLSERPQLLYNYFKQLFAQVTNPPIDCIREEIITATGMAIGTEGNLLDPRPESCRQINLPGPVLTNEQLERLRHVDRPGFKAVTLPMLFDVAGGGPALREAMNQLGQQATSAIEDGANILILSDRGLTRDRAPIPALLAVSGLHHHLIRQGIRTLVGLVVESGEPREVHHFSLLISYGASAVNPYLAYETIADLLREGLLPAADYEQAVTNYVKGATKGIVKTMAKMGISTIASYHGAQIFEAIGLHRDVVDKYFTWTSSRVGGIGLDTIAEEVRRRHEPVFAEQVEPPVLDAGGQYQYRQDGEFHLFNPESIHHLQLACRTGDYRVFQTYSALVNEQSANHCTLRSLLEFKRGAAPVPLDEVEPLESIVRRFKTGAMSYGSISQEAHEALAIAMNRLGGKSNTGEGGEDPARYLPGPDGDSRNSAIKQVASGRFGVTSHYLTQAKEIQIKMAQGAKPGEGGELPGAKVYPWIARVRFSTPGVGLISPPPHHDIYSIEDLAELIHDLKNANHEARISVKLVAAVGVGTIAAGVAKAKADVVLISGHDGGTGASPLSSIKHAGIPWELGLAETHQTLLVNNLRSRIVVETDGQLKTGRDVVIAALLGAEEFGFATAPLVALGCILMRVCHLNTCPVGVATQDPRLRARFGGRPEHAVNFMQFVAREVRELMAELGFRRFDDLVGRVDRLEMRPALEHWKAKGLDFSQILHQPAVAPGVGRYCQMPQDHGLDQSLDRQVLLGACRPALERGEPVRVSLPIRNINRVVSTILGSAVTRKYGPAGLPDDTIHLQFQGSAGQSFGAFVPRGITLELQGDANDYLGKGFSGGRLIVYPPAGSTFAPEENIIIGNVAFYGATAGEAYIGGMAGERFAVRNSGVRAVVESVGDHGCEYMTGGRVVVLGPTGRNFAAGMSGGIAYVLDVDGTFPGHCNRQMVGLEKLTDAAETSEVRGLIERHVALTGSARGRQILELWADMVPKFVKVLPHDYRRMMAALERVQARGLAADEAAMAAFEENAKDLARAGGN